MRLVTEFWGGIFLALIGGSVSFAAAYLISQQVGSLPVGTIAAVGALVGFTIGATGLEIWHTGVRRWASQLFGIDLRSLALMRIGLAISILIDLVMRARDLKAHYTDSGILPLEIRFYRPSILSLHLLSSEAWVQASLFVAAAMFALLFLVGYRTRLVTIVSWFLLISLQNRNPLILTGGDTLLRLLMFWSIFLPLGARYSVDHALNLSPSRNRTRYADAATFALLVQITCVYFFSGLLKAHPQWHVDGSAVYYALSLDILTTQVGQYLLNYPELLRSMTFFVIYLELATPALIFMPWRTGSFRFVFYLLFFGLHFGFMVCMWIGVFPLVGMSALSVLLPSGVWNWLGRNMLPARSARPVIYYDSTCRFCRRSALLVRTFLLLPVVRIRRGEICADVHDLMQRENSWVVTDAQGQTHTRFSGMRTLMNVSPLYWPVAKVFAWRPLAAMGDWWYRFVARNRRFFGRMTATLCVYRKRIRPFWPIQPLVFVLMIYVVLYNVTTLSGLNTKWFSKPTEFEVFGEQIKVDPTTIYKTGRHLRLDQNWKLFAPHPLMGDGWFVAEGITGDGREIDPRFGTEVSFEKPEYVAATFPNNRWRKYMELLRLRQKNPRFQLEYCRFLCRQWNESHAADDQLESVNLYFIMERSRPPYVQLSHERALLKQCDCATAYD